METEVASDLELIKQLFSSTHTEKSMRANTKLFSPNFVYKNKIQGALNFDAYCQYIGSLSFNYHLTVEDIAENDDFVTVTYFFEIVDNTNDFHAKLPGVANIRMQNGLVMSIDTTYGGSPKVSAYMRKYTPKFGSRQPE